MPLSAEPGRTSHDDPVPDQIRAGLGTYLRAMLAHAPGTRVGADPEELHQMRVAVRKMRALLKTGQAFLDQRWLRPLRAELGWLGGVLGPVRDLDVLLERLASQVDDFDATDRAAFARLTARLEEEHARNRRELVAALDSDRYSELVDRLTDATLTPPPSAMDSQVTLRDIVITQFHRLRKQVRQAGKDATDPELHALRIQGKRLRYAAELADSAGHRARRLVAACKRFQDVLGEHQDACVAAECVTGLLHRMGDRADTEAAFVAGRLVEREATRRAACRDRWWECWLDLHDRAEKWDG